MSEQKTRRHFSTGELVNPDTPLEAIRAHRAERADALDSLTDELAFIDEVISEREIAERDAIKS